jgi:hypothetical protein
MVRMLSPTPASRSRFTLRRFAVLAAAVSALTLPAAAGAADLHATPSTFASTYSAAQGGDTIYLATGSYGTWNGGSKSSPVTIKPETGASVTMALNFDPATNIVVDGLTNLTNLYLAGSATKNITVRNSYISGQTQLRTGSLANANILFDKDIFGPWDKCSSCGEGRVWLPERTSQPSGITIQNSTFGPGGNSDGVQNGSNGTQFLNNRFLSIHQIDGSSGVHADAIQLYGSQNTVIRGNLMYDVADCIMAPDGADHEVVENNACYSSGQGAAFTFESDNGSIIRHNTLLDTGAAQTCDYGIRCGELRLGNKSGDPAGRGTVVTDNIMAFISIPEGSQTYGSEGYNLMTAGKGPASTDATGTPVYVGGAIPSTFAGYALAAGSPGKGSASDGTDRGVNVGSGGGSPPPPDTTPPDTTITSGPGATTSDSTPTFTFTSSEAGSTFACRVDQGAYAACTSPWTTPVLADGAHSVAVRATDAAGNTDATPATQSFTVSTTTPPTDHTPVAAYTYSPLAPLAGQTVAFDASSSTCADTPCTYAWADDGSDGPGGTQWPLGTGRTMSFTFQQAGTKNVRLTVTDVDGDTATTMKSIVVGAAAPPPPTDNPPTVTLTSPLANATIGTWTRVSATASDDHGVARVEFWVDSTLVATDTQTPYTARIRTSGLSSGTHTVTARAFDTAGQAASSAVTVTKGSSGAATARVARSGASRRGAKLASVSAAGGATRLVGTASPRQAVSVALTRCASHKGAVVARVRVKASSRGRLDAATSKSDLCVLRMGLS